MTAKTSKSKPASRPAKRPLSAEAAQMKTAIQRHLKCSLARDEGNATARDWWIATAIAVRDSILERMLVTMGEHRRSNTRRVNYLSLEYLMGRLFTNNLVSLGLHEAAVDALDELGLDFQTIRGAEEDMGLGNGGLGRLAACYLDSLATLDLPAVGYGIHYEFGLFRQEFVHGHQVEHPDNWIVAGAPWEVIRPDWKQEVKLFGR